MLSVIKLTKYGVVDAIFDEKVNVLCKQLSTSVKAMIEAAEAIAKILRSSSKYNSPLLLF